MASKSTENSFTLEACPIRDIVARFGSKWTLLIIIVLHRNGSTRFNQIGKLIPDISTKVLSEALQTLEADNLVKRTVFPEVPIRVEYELSELGQSLIPIIRQLTDWAVTNMPEILSHRKKYASKK